MDDKTDKAVLDPQNTDPTKTDFPIKLGDKEFTVCYPVPSIWAFEDASGISLLTGVLTAQELLGENLRQSMERTACLLWAGMLVHHPDVASNDDEATRKRTLLRVGRLLFPRDLDRVRDEVLVAFFAALPRIKIAEAQAGEGPLAPSSLDS